MKLEYTVSNIEGAYNDNSNHIQKFYPNTFTCDMPF